MKKKLALAGCLSALACVALPSQAAVAAGCSGDYPASESSVFDGFLVVCTTGDGRFARIENISTVVYNLWPRRGSRITDVFGPAGFNLVVTITRESARATCPGRRYCVLPPGGSAYVSGSPAQVLVDPDATATRLTLAARLIAGGIDRRLWPQTRTGSVMACARHVAGTLQSEGWVQLRGGINVATSCPTLVKELYPGLEQRIRLNTKVAKVGTRILRQEGFLDVVLSGLKTLIRY